MAIRRTLMSLKSVHFEVFGRVQGVFFRKGTLEVSQQEGVVGWVKNTARGTVVGVLQGEEEKVENVKQWLAHKGSKRSRIDRCEFTREKVIDRIEYSEFCIRK